MMAFIFDICLVWLVDDLKEVDIALQTAVLRMIFGWRWTCAYILIDDITQVSHSSNFAGDRIIKSFNRIYIEFRIVKLNYLALTQTELQ